MADEGMTDRELANEVWYWYLNGKRRVARPLAFEQELIRRRRLYRLLPGSPRCRECLLPLAGPGGWVARLAGRKPSTLTPRLCNTCESLILAAEGGAEIELSLLFADIRGSTPLAARQGAMEYRDYIQRFYKASARVLIERNALVNRLVGDQVIGLFVPRFAGPQHASVAVEAATAILQATGHADAGGPWVPVGVGVHTGTAYVGAVGSKDGVNEIAVLGNAANLTARLSSRAAAGEVLVSEQAAVLADLEGPVVEKRRVKLKGFSKPVPVQVIAISSPTPQ